MKKPTVVAAVISVSLLGILVATVAAEPKHSLAAKNKSASSRRATKSFAHSVANPIREVDITTPVSGTVSVVLVEEGEHVRAGQSLLELDSRLSQARLGMARAEYQRSASAAEATKLESQLAESRYRNLAAAFRKDAATRVEVMEARIRWQQAIARHQTAIDLVSQAKESMKMAEVETQIRTVKSPFEATAVRVLAVPGLTPTVNDTLIKLVDTTRLRTDFYLPIQQSAKFREGQTVRVLAESPVDAELTAKLVVVDEVIDAATQTIRVVAEIDNRAGKLPAGFRVRLAE